LVPLYFLHRYQLEAVVKLVGGQEYDYGVKGAANTAVKSVSSKEQRKALQALVAALDRTTLSIPTAVRELLPPHAFGYGASRESFATQTGLTFDPFGAAHTLSDAVLGMLLHPHRASRLAQQGVFDANQLTLKETLSLLIETAFKVKHSNAEAKALQQIVQGNLMQHLMRLGSESSVSHRVRGEVHEQLYALDQWIKNQKSMPYAHFYRSTIENYFEHPSEIQPLRTPKIPDGSPIGMTLECY